MSSNLGVGKTLGLLERLRSAVRDFTARAEKVNAEHNARTGREQRLRATAAEKQAKELAAGLGIDLQETAVGGGSDGNFTAGLGVPTLDGLGAVGEGAHASHESVVLSETPRRAGLLARLIERV